MTNQEIELGLKILEKINEIAGIMFGGSAIENQLESREKHGRFDYEITTPRFGSVFMGWEPGQKHHEINKSLLKIFGAFGWHWIERANFKELLENQEPSEVS